MKSNKNQYASSTRPLSNRSPLTCDECGGGLADTRDGVILAVGSPGEGPVIADLLLVCAGKCEEDLQLALADDDVDVIECRNLRELQRRLAIDTWVAEWRQREMEGDVGNSHAVMARVQALADALGWMAPMEHSQCWEPRGSTYEPA